VDRTIEPRLNQIFVPLLSIVEDVVVRAELQDLARRYHGEIIAERGWTPEAQVLEIVRDMLVQEAPLAVKGHRGLVLRPTRRRVRAQGDGEMDSGWIIRKRLRLQTQKRHGVFVIADGMSQKLETTIRPRYGVNRDEPSVAPQVPPPSVLPGAPRGGRVSQQC
jgi:hypothetical protein